MYKTSLGEKLGKLPARKVLVNGVLNRYGVKKSERTPSSSAWVEVQNLHMLNA